MNDFKITTAGKICHLNQDLIILAETCMRLQIRFSR